MERDDNSAGVFGQRLDAVRAELADLAFRLECQGRLDAADVANVILARLGEIHDEVTGAPSFHHDPANARCP